MLGRIQTLWHELQRHQNRTAVWGVQFACLLVGFLIFYLPAEAQYQNLSKISAERTREIEVAKKSGLNLLEPKELEAAAKNVKDFESQLIDVSQASTTINLVSDEAAKHNFTIANINSENLAPVRDEAAREIERDGKKLKRIPIHIQFQADLKNLAEFLKSLSDSSKRLWVLESLSIQKTSPQSGDLTCDMTLSFFAY
jgi:Tfp pilus assembly protein PilO